MDTPIIVTDQAILSFYKENPNLDFITINHVFIDILKKLSTNLNETINNNINGKILSTLTDLTKEIVCLKQDMTCKFHETKREYLEDVKYILSNNSLTTNEKINSILEKNSDTIITKTNLIMNDIIPKHHDKYYSQIDNSIRTLHNSINVDIVKFMENFNKDEKSLTHFINNVDAQFNKMITNLQQPIFSFIQSSEERTTNNIQQIREKIIHQHSSQDKLNNELNGFLNKYKYNSSSKGNISESELYFILQQIFPSDEIIDCSNETSTCDYRVNRLNVNKPTILFENKDYAPSVKTEEVRKFERDLKLQNSHGIFISQKSSITFKENFQIDIIEGLIHVYLPNAEYNLDKIKIAVDIIDNLSFKLEYLKNNNENTTINIVKEDLVELVELYNDFTKQKNMLIETIKTSNKQILERIESIQINSIKKLLNKNGLFQDEHDFTCKFCAFFVGKNKMSLNAHTRVCKSNPTNIKSN